MVDQLNLRLSGRALELALRLPPLYLMDAILLQEMALKAPLFGLDATASSSPGATDGEPSSATLTTQEGQRVRVTEAPRAANFSLELEAAAAGLDPGAAAPWEQVYTRLYGGSAEAALLPCYLANVLLGCAAYLAAAFVLSLSLRQLLVFYAYAAALLCLPLSYLSHAILTETLGQLATMKDQVSGHPSNAEWFLHRMLSSSSPLLPSVSLDVRAIVANYLVQTALGLVLASVLKLHFTNRELLTKVVTLSMLSPNVFAVLAVPVPVLEMASVLSLALPLLLTLVALGSVAGGAAHSVMATYRRRRQLVHNFGLNVFLETEWARLRVPALLRTFWITRLGLHLVLELLKVPSAGVIWTESASLLGRRLVTRGAETIIAILGMTSVVSSICHYVGSFFHAVLTANSALTAAEDMEEKSIASVSAVLFFVLALQTGLTTLEPEKRFSRLCKNFCLLLTALFHFIHNMVSPVLMSLSASRNFTFRRHLRALAICVFLVLAPTALMTYLWQISAVGTWLLAVSAFCVEVIVKVAVTVSVYLLLLYDQHYKSGTWEALDDAVYYVKAAGNSVEFCFAVFLFFNGGWILMFESGGTIRAVMMLIHAYCNIWLEARAGWATFMKRRTAASKINSLPDATRAQLEAHNDVCAICYQEMTTSAKITQCRHFFHGLCLRKWLYVQDTCPLCYGALYHKSSLVSSENDDANNNNDNQDDARRRDRRRLRRRGSDFPEERASGGEEEEELLAESEVDADDLIDNDDAEEDDASSTDSESSSSPSSVGVPSSLSSSVSSLAAGPSSLSSSSSSAALPGTDASAERAGDRVEWSSGVSEDLIYDALTDGEDGQEAGEEWPSAGGGGRH